MLSNTRIATLPFTVIANVRRCQVRECIRQSPPCCFSARNISSAIYKNREEQQKIPQLHPKFWQTLDDSGGPAHFWEEQARRHVTWYHNFHTVQHHDTERGQISWFLGGVLNASGK